MKYLYPTHSDLSYLGFAVGQEDKEKLLHEVAKLGDVERVVELLKEGVHISYKDNLGYSALHWASLYGHLHVCTLLSVNLVLPLLYLEEVFLFTFLIFTLLSSLMRCYSILVTSFLEHC